MENLLVRLLNPALIWILIPITWLVLTTIFEIIKVSQRHRERMALINQGIHPDLEPEREGTAASQFSELGDAANEGNRVNREAIEYEAAT